MKLGGKTLLFVITFSLIDCEYRKPGEVTPGDLFAADVRFNKLINETERLLAGFIRLGFHDCVGGCDGCVDLSEPDNIGLEEAVTTARKFQTDYLPQLSVGDVFAYLAIRSLEETVKRAGGLVKIGLKRGRIDCSPNDVPTRIFPLGNDPIGLRFLEKEFGLTTKQAVALLGCHSVGRTRPQSSGYHGKWDFTEFVMDNDYFRNMIASAWVLEQVSNDMLNATQFSKGDDLMMLLADMGLFKSLTNTRDFFHTPSCNYYTCGFAPTYKIVEAYANNMTLFHSDLAIAFTKMVENTPYSLVHYG